MNDESFDSLKVAPACNSIDGSRITASLSQVVSSPTSNGSPWPVATTTVSNSLPSILPRPSR